MRNLLNPLAALTVELGLVDIGTDATGTTGALCWLPGQQYGRWEARMKSAPADPPLTALAQLRPDAGARSRPSRSTS